MQFKVPQNIDMADRIVGPLTLVQFLYLLLGGIIVYILFSIIAPVNGTLFLVLAGPVALFTLALTFLRIQDQPFPKFVAAFFIFLVKPKLRVWHREGFDPELVITKDDKSKKAATPHKNIKRSELERLVLAVDTGGHIPNRPVAATAKIVSQVAPPNYLKKGRPVLDAVKRK